MTGPVLLGVLLGLTAASVGLLALIEWLHGIRQTKAAVRAAQDVLAGMGRHNLPPSRQRAHPPVARAQELSSLGEQPTGRPRGIPVGELVARAEDEGSALRLNWRYDDEQRAKQGTSGVDPSEFPTAVLPVLADGESSRRGR
jgi:hypothetical protein